MSNKKGSLIIFALLVLAFAWGYTGGINVPTASKAKESTQKQVEETKEAEVGSNEAIPLEFGPVSSRRNPASANVALYNNQRSNSPDTNTPRRAPMLQQENPYINFMKSVGQAGKGQLSDSLKTFKKGGLDQTQKTQRNAYFEKLSQQLKELQGGGGPIPANEPPPSANVPSEVPKRQTTGDYPVNEAADIIAPENQQIDLVPQEQPDLINEDQDVVVDDLDSEIDAFLEDEAPVEATDEGVQY